MTLMHYERAEKENLFLNSVNCLYSIDKSADFWSVIDRFETCLQSSGFEQDEGKSMPEVHVFSKSKTSVLVSSTAVALMSLVRSSADLNDFLRLNDIVISAFEGVPFENFETVACVRYHSIKLNVKEIGITTEDARNVVFSNEIKSKVRFEERDDYFSIAQLGEKEVDGVVEFSLAITSSKKGVCKRDQLRTVISALSDIEYDMWRSSITDEMYNKMCVND